MGKKNLLGLVAISGLLYAVYFLWLYRASNGTMVVRYEPPEWTFPFIAGIFVFVFSFAGGSILLAFQGAEEARESRAVPQLLALSLLFAGLSTVSAFVMTGYLSKAEGLLAGAVFLGVWALLARMNAERLRPEGPVVDERTELIELKSWALAGRNMTTVASITLLLALFHLWNPDAETLSFLLMLTWSISMMGARAYYSRRM